MPMAYFYSILVTRLTVDFNRENGGLVFQPFLDFRVEIFTEDGHFLAISVFIIVTGLKPQNKKQFGVRLYRQFWEKFIDMSQKFVDEYRECQYDSMNQQKPNASEEFWHQIQLKKSDRHCGILRQS